MRRSAFPVNGSDVRPPADAARRHGRSAGARPNRGDRPTRSAFVRNQPLRQGSTMRFGRPQSRVVVRSTRWLQDRRKRNRRRCGGGTHVPSASPRRPGERHDRRTGVAAVPRARATVDRRSGDRRARLAVVVAPRVARRAERGRLGDALSPHLAAGAASRRRGARARRQSRAAVGGGRRPAHRVGHERRGEPSALAALAARAARHRATDGAAPRARPTRRRRAGRRARPARRPRRRGARDVAEGARRTRGRSGPAARALSLRRRSGPRGMRRGRRPGATAHRRGAVRVSGLDVALGDAGRRDDPLGPRASPAARRSGDRQRSVARSTPS